ncbi:hypothetical protein BCR35DRAFT_279523 [Leucosporidium creatinivorum]|uniref:ATP-dependent DNA ligase family profile domain-containing protein n=1 Tax=Leucosporidium creatinivorum TaxID=106004 RepID=A0A1Y2F6R6_9BASI|nr:hypothetical protein BCR35DRAFT_279523 [Leucosporidium creatinivorum]
MKRSQPEEQQGAAPNKKSKQQSSVPTLTASTKAAQEAADARLARELAESEGLVLKERKERKRDSGSSKSRDMKLEKGNGKMVQQQDEQKPTPKLGSEDDSDDDLIIVDDPPPKPTPKKSLASFFAPKPQPSPKLKPDPEQKPSTKRRPSASPSKPSGGSFFATSIKKEAKSTPVPSTSKLVAVKPLDTSLYEFNPSTDVDTSLWPGGRMPYSFLTEAFVIVSATKSRLIISRVLTNLLRTAIELDPASLQAIIYLTTNRLGPAHEKDLELGIGSQVLGKAIRDVSGLTPAAVKALSNKLGDAGDIAFEAKKTVRLLVQPTPLVCHKVFSTLLSLTRLKGSGSQDRKTATVKQLLVAAKGEEVRFITRTIVANLRIGAVRLSLLTALARATCLSRKGGVGEGEEPEDEWWVTKAERARVLKELSAARKGKIKVKEEEERRVEQKMEKAEQLVRKVWARHPQYGHLVDALLADAFIDLETRVPLAVGTPLEPMLGSPTRALTEIYTRLGQRPFVAEAKLDGQRGQIHVSTTAPEGAEESGQGCWYDPLPGTEGKRLWVRVFSRHLLDMTDKYPDIAYTLSALVHRESTSAEPLTDFILDCEIVAIDPATGALKTFQELSYRSRKDVEMGDIKVRVGIYAFDLMYLNGESLLGLPFRRRRELLHERFAPLKPSDVRLARYDLVPSCTDNDPEKVKEFFEETLKMKAEGIMVKLLDEAEVEVASDEEEGSDSSGSPSTTSTSPSKPSMKRKGRRKVLPATYEPDKRADSWLKVKKDYLEDLGDSLDLIPIGAWHGNGRKASWWSPILLGCYDQDTGLIQAVCKCMSGFTDEKYKEINVRYALDGENTTKIRPSEIEAGNLKPSVWFVPQEVWEIRGADFTLSPVYPAAQSLLGERGVSLRFPRFVKVRDDKGIEQATSSEQLAGLYERQSEGGGGKARGGEE